MQFRSLQPENNITYLTLYNKFFAREIHFTLAGDANENYIDMRTDKISKITARFVYGVMHLKMLTALADVAGVEQYTKKAIANNIVTPNTCRMLIKYMKHRSVTHHTYQLKETRSIQSGYLYLTPHSANRRDKKRVKNIQLEGLHVRAITNIRHLFVDTHYIPM